MLPWSPTPAAGGRVTRPVRDGGGVGGPAGGTTCSGTCGAPIPLASGRRSPTTGEGAICLRAPEPHERGRGGALPVSCGACTAQLVRPWRAGVPAGPAQHSWCGPGVRGFLWGLHSTAGAALARGGSCGACTAQLVRPWRAGVPVGPAQHSWCGPGVRGFLWGLHSTAGAALACGGSCGACTAQLVRPWRAGVPVGPAQHSWCGPGVQVVPVGPAQHSWCGPGVLSASRGAGTAQLVRPRRVGAGSERRGSLPRVLRSPPRDLWSPLNVSCERGRGWGGGRGGGVARRGGG